MRDVVLLALWLLPSSSLKRRLLAALGHAVHPSAGAGPNLVWKVRRLDLAAGSDLGRYNIFKHLEHVDMGPQTALGRFNQFSAHPAYAQVYDRAGVVVLAECSKITSRHQLDCSGGVYLGRFSSIAGKQTLVMSHSIDFRRDAQAAYPVHIGDYGFVGTRCLVLGGAELPARSILAGGSVLTRARAGEVREPGVWAGNPATRRSSVDGKWFGRSRRSTQRIYDPVSGTIVEDAF